jgi:hypothetical protein
MAKRNQYRDHIPWRVLEQYLYELRDSAFTEFMKAEGLQAVGQAQGAALAFNKLLNLPETLELRELAAEENKE